MITRWQHYLSAAMITRWHYCIMITRWHYCITAETAKNFGLQEENINISKPQGKTTN